jgi:hypothetical protein
MKIMLSLLILCCAVTAAGQDGASRFVPKNNTAGINNCTGAPHDHRWSDLRMIAVEVREKESCGFSYVDLETNTVGLDNHAEFSPFFSLSRFLKDGGESKDIQRDELAKKAIRKGIRGIAIICQHCKTALTMRLFAENMQSVAQF